MAVKKSKNSIVPPPPSPAMQVDQNHKICAVDTLNAIIDQLVHTRDALIGVENLESMDSAKPLTDMRERIRQKVYQQGEALKNWRAQE